MYVGCRRITLPPHVDRQLHLTGDIGDRWIAHPVEHGTQIRLGTYSPAPQALDGQGLSARADELAAKRIQTGGTVRVEVCASDGWNRKQVRGIESVEAKEVCVIEHVEEVSPQFDPNPFPDGNSTSHGEVEAVVGVALARVARRAAIEELEIHVGVGAWSGACWKQTAERILWTNRPGTCRALNVVAAGQAPGALPYTASHAAKPAGPISRLPPA